MPVGRRRLYAEAALATVLGLFTLLVERVGGAGSTVGHSLSPATRALFVVGLVTGPGRLLGPVAFLLVPGLTTADRVYGAMYAVGIVANMALFGASWFVLRSGASRSKLRRGVDIALSVWVVGALCIGAWASQFIGL